MQKEFILERRGWFKGWNIRVEDDYNEEIRKVRKELVEYMFKAHWFLAGFALDSSFFLFPWAKVAPLLFSTQI